MIKMLLCLGLLALTSSIYAYETPQQIKERYRHMYSSNVETHPDGSQSFHQAHLFRRGGLYILSLKGDPFEMAFQHGKLLKSEISRGALPQVAKIVENSVRNAFPAIPLVTDFVISYLHKNYTDQILKNGIEQQGGNPEKTMLEAYGLAEGASVPVDMAVYGALGPESLQVILGKQLSGSLLLPKGSPTGVMLKNCTDFAIRGSYTEKGEMIIGRNTDYPLNGSFDRFPTVIYYHPTDGAQRYMAVTSAGIHSAGVIGYNESGLFLGVHTIPTLEVSEKGISIFFVGQEIMRTARNFEEAIAIFKRYKPAAGWAYTLVSVRENRMATVELTNKQMAVLESKGDLHVQTNHFSSPSMVGANLDLNNSVNEDTRARKLRVESLANKWKGQFDSFHAVKTLSDKWDPIHHKPKGLGNVVAVHTTLSSAVFDPVRGRAFVASGLAPVSLTTYIEIPLIDSFDPSHFPSEFFSTLENSNYFTDYPEIAQAEQLYIEAKTAFETELNPKKSFHILKQASALDPSNAAYSFVEGIMALKAELFNSATKAFQRCENLDSKHHRLLGQYYLGRIHADSGNRKKAIEKLEKVLMDANPIEEAPLLLATQNALTKLKKRLPVRMNTDSLSLFMPEADMVQY